MSLQVISTEPRLQEWMSLFHQATGLAIRLVDTELAMIGSQVCGHEHSFCRESGALGSHVCQETRAALRKKVSSKMTPVTHKCATGLTEVAVPLVVNRKHVGTFFVGQTLSAKPDAKSWARLLDTMDGIANLKQLQPLRSKYLKGQVVEADALTPLVQMVALHSHRLSRNLKPAKAKTAKKVAGKRTAKKH